MDHIFWLVEGKLAGRSGPNLNPWRLEDIAASGYSAILSVNDGEGVHESLIQSLGLQYSCIPMSDNAPAHEGDLEFCLTQMPKALKFISENWSKGPVLIHCRSGKDRTGLVMAAVLVKFYGCSASVAMQKVLEVRPIAYSAPGWIGFAKDVLTQYEHDILGFSEPILSEEVSL